MIIEDIINNQYVINDINEIHSMIHNCDHIRNLCIYIIRIFQIDLKVDENYIPSRLETEVRRPRKSIVYPDLPRVIHSPEILRAFYVACLRYYHKHNDNSIISKYSCIMDIDKLPYETIQLELVYQNEIYKILEREDKI